MIEVNLKRILFLFVILFLTYFACGSKTLAQINNSNSFGYYYNFGNSQNKIKGYQNVSDVTFYPDNNSFGIISRDIHGFARTEKWTKLLPLMKTGLRSDDKIEFKSKIKAGEYYLEILMDGGNTGLWKGNILVNGVEIKKELSSFTRDPESDEAPKYWSFIREVKIDTDEFLFSIRAENQPVTINALTLISKGEASLELINGKITADKNFSCPNNKLIIDLLNKGSVNEALRLIDAIPESMFLLEKAQLLLATAGRLETENPRQIIENSLRILNSEKKTNNSPEVELNIKVAQLYSFADQRFKSGGWDWTSDLAKSGIFDHIEDAGMAFEEISRFENHPLQIRATYELAKVEFQIWLEQQARGQRSKSDKHFNIVKKYYPDNKLIKMYLGERLSTVSYPKWDKKIPEWAFLQKKAMDGILDIIHYWVENRQADNGEFGGKYDDDVEMLRWWGVSRNVVNDSVALLGMQRLVDGIWNSKWIENGWSRKLKDVEHSSEPIADTQPMMIGFDYGNPIYVERCMESAAKLELWTGINSRGHRHFKSSWYSSSAIDTTAPKNCDVEMNTRTIKAINWLAWYNHHPTAIKFLKEWGDAWLEDCLRTEKDKPKGIVPAAIRFRDDAISGYSENWYDSGMFWDYYNFGGGSKMLNQFLVNYLLFNDTKYLQPIELALELIEKYENEDLENSEPGSEKWTANELINSGGFAETVEIWRIITNNSKYDKLIVKLGSDYIKFLLTKNEKYNLDGIKNIIDGTYNNRELNTTEAYFTDRVEIRDLSSRKEWSSTHIESIYTGSPFLDTFYPFNPISWRGFGNNFAALVLDSSPTNLKIKIINLSDNVINGAIIFHQLENGSYNFVSNATNNGKNIVKTKFEVLNRNSELQINLIPGVEQIIEINQIESYDESKKELADLAITKSELQINNGEEDNIIISIPIHNIGIKEALNLKVSIYEIVNGISQLLKTVKVAQLEAPLDLLPKIAKVNFSIKSSDNEHLIKVDPSDHIEEITEINNKISFKIN
jgi:hypothetical protein